MYAGSLPSFICYHSWFHPVNTSALGTSETTSLPKWLWINELKGKPGLQVYILYRMYAVFFSSLTYIHIMHCTDFHYTLQDHHIAGMFAWCKFHVSHECKNKTAKNVNEWTFEIEDGLYFHLRPSQVCKGQAPLDFRINLSLPIFRHRTEL